MLFSASSWRRAPTKSRLMPKPPCSSLSPSDAAGAPAGRRNVAVSHVMERRGRVGVEQSVLGMAVRVDWFGGICPAAVKSTCSALPGFRPTGRPWPRPRRRPGRAAGCRHQLLARRVAANLVTEQRDEALDDVLGCVVELPVDEDGRDWRLERAGGDPTSAAPLLPGVLHDAAHDRDLSSLTPGWAVCALRHRRSGTAGCRGPFPGRRPTSSGRSRGRRTWGMKLRRPEAIAGPAGRPPPPAGAALVWPGSCTVSLSPSRRIASPCGRGHDPSQSPRPPRRGRGGSRSS